MQVEATAGTDARKTKMRTRPGPNRVDWAPAGEENLYAEKKNPATCQEMSMRQTGTSTGREITSGKWSPTLYIDTENSKMKTGNQITCRNPDRDESSPRDHRIWPAIIERNKGNQMGENWNGNGNLLQLQMKNRHQANRTVLREPKENRCTSANCRRSSHEQNNQSRNYQI
jgi:hypothetical protein